MTSNQHESPQGGKRKRDRGLCDQQSSLYHRRLFDRDFLGVLSLVLLPKDLLPPANLPAVQILSFYPGMPVDHVEQDLTYLYERYTGQAVGIETQESRSIMGVSMVKNFSIRASI